MKTLLFHRDFQKFQGGHLKVWNYFDHTRQSEGYTPKVYFTVGSSLGADNPWSRAHADIMTQWAPHKASALFFGGTDWAALDEAERDEFRVPIINIIQGFRHVDPNNVCFSFLRHRALRICVNPLLEDALRKTNRANGPIVTIPMGLSLPEQTKSDFRQGAVLIAAQKQPRLGKAIAAYLRQKHCAVELLDQALPRPEFLARIGGAGFAIFLPASIEGFYLPPLEAMAMGQIVICPDCLGNRTYLEDGRNGFMPNYNEAAICDTVHRVLSLSASGQAAIRDAARVGAQRFSIEQERQTFVNILQNFESDPALR